MEEDLDLDLALLVNLVLDLVGAVVLIGEGVRDLGVVADLGNFDLEDVETGLSVLTEVVTSLDDELSRVADCRILQETRAERKRLVSSGVHEVGEQARGSGKISTLN